jgi:hypothetical protein
MAKYASSLNFSGSSQQFPFEQPVFNGFSALCAVQQLIQLL